MTTRLPPATRPVPVALLWLAVIGFMVSLFGVYWDDAWHTDIGRDRLLSAPHVVLYAGTALAIGAVGVWLARVARLGGMPALRFRRPLVVAAVGGAVTIGSAPIDEFWHVSFGRDAVLWSPPHVVAAVGVIALAAGVLLEVDRTADKSGPELRLLAGASLLGALMVTVLEYDSDVPQFALGWYLPLLSVVATLAFVMIRRVSPGNWSATSAALVHGVLMAVVAAVLTGMGRSAPIVPILVVPAIGFDLASRRRIVAPVVGSVVAGLVFLAYVPYLNLVYRGVEIGAAEVLGGIVLAGVGSAVVSSVLTWSPRRTAAGLAGLALLGLVLSPTSAFAHDPGQGEEIGRIGLTGFVAAGVAHIEASLPDDLVGSLTPLAVKARRAGELVTGTFENDGAAYVHGQVEVPDRGRWFVYVEYERGGEVVEAWTALSTEIETPAVAEVSLYVPPVKSDSATKLVVGVILYAAAVWILGLAVSAYRGDVPLPPPRP